MIHILVILHTYILEYEKRENASPLEPGILSLFHFFCYFCIEGINLEKKKSLKNLFLCCNNMVVVKLFCLLLLKECFVLEHRQLRACF